MEGASNIQLLIITQSIIIRFVHIPQIRSLQVQSAYSRVLISYFFFWYFRLHTNLLKVFCLSIRSYFFIGVPVAIQGFVLSH